MKQIDVYTDGACSGNPGPGGWGAILRYGAHEKEICGAEKETTNNRMELTAVISALMSLNQPCSVKITTDSKYVVDSVNNGWLKTWKENGWKKSNKKDVQNVDLWEKLLILMSVHEVSFSWIKGHDGHRENERCDYLARACIQS